MGGCSLELCPAGTGGCIARGSFALQKARVGLWVPASKRVHGPDGCMPLGLGAAAAPLCLHGWEMAG